MKILDAGETFRCRPFKNWLYLNSKYINWQSWSADLLYLMQPQVLSYWQQTVTQLCFLREIIGVLVYALSILCIHDIFHCCNFVCKLVLFLSAKLQYVSFFPWLLCMVGEEAIHCGGKNEKT